MAPPERLAAEAGVATTRGLSAAPLIAAALAWLAALAWVRPLTVPDEGRYTDIARWMGESGDWIVPRLDGLPFLHKPPLYYWLEAAAIGALGHHLIVYRLASLLAAGVIILCVHTLAQRLSGEAAARWSVVLLATNPLFYMAAQFANLDLGVAALMTAVITLVVLAFENAYADGRPRRPLLVAAYAVSGLAVLTKGLIGCVIPGLVFVAYALVMGRPRWLLQAISPIGLVVFAGIVAPWFIAMEGRIPGFTRYFIVFHHFQRYTETSFNERHPFWFYPAELLGGTLPWSVIGLVELFLARQHLAWNTLPRLARLGLVWLVATVVFFSIPSSKLPGYILIAVPAIALLAGPFFAGYRFRLVAAGIGAVLCVGVVLGWGSIIYRKQTPLTLARTLKTLATPEDRVVFYANYWPDCAVALDRRTPIVIVDDWTKTTAELPDNQKRQLTEGREFAPALAKGVLVERGDFPAMLALGQRTYVLADRASADSAPLKSLERIAETPRYVLLRSGPK
jgi:4-amino-4-deoxy-L-arabinose transferase-like glycosyltransferase